MIIFNVTVKLEPMITEAWLHWLKQEHIPAIMDTGCFTDFRIVKLLEIDESDGPTYAIQYTAESKADYNRYTEIFAAKLRQEATDKWGDAFIAFRSVMEVVD